MATIPQRGMRGLDNLKKEFDQYFGSLPFMGSNSEEMRVDIYETEIHVIAECDLPGIEQKEDIHVDIINNRNLKVSAVKEGSKVSEEQHFARKERFNGKIDRSITLPKDVTLEGTTASYKNGVLKITMPKTNIGGESQVDIKFD